jgi:hypothetical protein
MCESYVRVRVSHYLTFDKQSHGWHLVPTLTYTCVVAEMQLANPIVQYVLPSKNKQLKKLSHFYWEMCPKYDDDGKLTQEIILVFLVYCVILCLI